MLSARFAGRLDGERVDLWHPGYVPDKNMGIKGDVFVLTKTFSIIFRSIDFFSLFQVSFIIKLSEMNKKKLGGYRTCLEDSV